MSNYTLETNGDFIINNYNRAKAFSSFLPGIAGKTGIPMWVFYANRGQGITSCGINNKNESIMEFHPANKAYHLVFTHGFRTFMKVNEKYYEPFAQNMKSENIEQTMRVKAHELEIDDTNHQLGVHTNITYYTLPLENFAALIRVVTLKNISTQCLELELIDGMPFMVPGNVLDNAIKGVSNTRCGTVEVTGIESDIVYSRTKVKLSDGTKVEMTERGNFYFTLLSQENSPLNGLPVIADPTKVFGEDGSFTHPYEFIESDCIDLNNQSMHNYMSCALAYHKCQLNPGQQITLYAMTGQSESLTLIKDFRDALKTNHYFLQKRNENSKIINTIQDKMFTASSNHIFDSYCRYTFLDNVLRGGYPQTIGDKTFHIYHRKHGDMERDYNFFVVQPTFYSQGDANYRDINQNRRCDVFFNKSAGIDNIYTFFNAIQPDGNNPLVYEGTYFVLKEKPKNLSNSFIENFNNTFTPGEVLKWATENIGDIHCSPDEFLVYVIQHSERQDHFKAAEAYWSDHWTYCLDLLESYKGIFPENIESLLFESNDFYYFDNHEVQLPRSKRYVLSRDENEIRQYNSIEVNSAKSRLIASRKQSRNIVRNCYGEGNIHYVSLFEKILSIICNKFANLDPDGIGI